ncbi:MAG: response regulator [Polyangiaceae bacterium]|nr:response regulator [Polyangiaceae bacterium]
MARTFIWHPYSSTQVEAPILGTLPPESTVVRRPPSASGKPQILAVDDDPLILRTLQRVLKATRPNWNITAAPSAATALQQLGVQHFDVLLTDLDMPGMRGEALLEAALAVHPNLTCVVHSGQIEGLNPALRSKLAGIVGKPATMIELGEALDNAVSASKRRRLKAVPLV